MKNIALGLLALIITTPVAAQSVSGCGSTAIAKAAVRDAAALQKQADCFGKVETVARDAKDRRLATVKSLTFRTRVGMNLAGDGLNYYGAQYAFIDRAKSMGGWGMWELKSDTVVPRDADGVPTAVPAGLTQLNGIINMDRSPARYVVTWKGKAKLWFGAQIVSSEPNRIVLDYKGSDTDYQLIASVKDIDGFRDFHVVREDLVPAFARGEIFDPVFLKNTSRWSTLRMMDWGLTNNNLTVEWADRSKVTDATWINKGAPIEMMIALANQANCDLWYNLPPHASDDFVRRAMILIRDTLKPGLKVYVEDGNEAWNWQFEQAQSARDAANRLWRPAAQTGDLEGGWMVYYGYRATQIAQIAEDVFAKDRSRLVNVFSSQPAWIDLFGYAKKGADLASGGTLRKGLFNVYALTGYIGGSLMGHDPEDRAKVLEWAQAGQSGVDAAFAAIFTGAGVKNQDSLVTLNTLLDAQAKNAAVLGVPIVGYEGGFHFNATSYEQQWQAMVIDFQRRIVNDPRAGVAYQGIVEAFAKRGAPVINIFTDVGEGTKWGFWGTRWNTYGEITVRENALLPYGR